MTDVTPDAQGAAQPVKRPTLLTVLCILTFIGSGLNILSGLVIGVFFDQFVPIVTEMAETYHLPELLVFANGSPTFFFISAALYAVSAGGALMMWRLRKIGFHVYTITQILLILVPMYLYKIPGPSVADLIFTGVFVMLYSLNLKVMK